MAKVRKALVAAVGGAVAAGLAALQAGTFTGATWGVVLAAAATVGLATWGVPNAKA